MEFHLEKHLVKNFFRIHGKNADDFLKKHGVTFKGASSFMGYVKPLRKPGVSPRGVIKGQTVQCSLKWRPKTNVISV